MSKIQGKPFIEKVIQSLTDALRTDLVSLINGANQSPAFRSLINSSHYISAGDKNKVSHVVLETWNKTYTGYLIYTDDFCVVISYSRNTQDLDILTINLTNQSYKIVREPLTITELRFELEEGSEGADVIAILNEQGVPRGVEVTSITSMSDNVLNELKPGYEVIKKTGNQRHTYLVSYKENGQGICLTYTDASVVETVSYDYVGGHWVYNSTDVVTIDAGQEIVELTGLSGTLSNDDYAKVSGDNCVIKMSTQYLYRAFNASTLIVYQALTRQAGTGKALFDYVEITKADKTWELKADDIVEANPTVPEGETPTDLTGLKVGNAYYNVPSGSGGGGADTDVTVEIESNYTSTDYANRTSYATAITLQEFIANCEAGNVYTNAGIIAKVNNMISGKAFRIILIGTNHEVLAYDDTTQAKTTWQFLDMPEHKVRLGLPINLLDWDSGSGRSYVNQYLDASNSASMTLYSSNMGGLIEAAGLLESAHSIFDELPQTLQRHIKTVRRYYYRKRNYMSVAASAEGAPGAESNSSQMCDMACNVFHLAGTDLGTSGQSGEGSGSVYTYLNTGAANRIRFYNGTAASYWTASPRTSTSYRWCYIDDSGSDGSNNTGGGSGVAPAFCI